MATKEFLYSEILGILAKDCRSSLISALKKLLELSDNGV